MRRRLDEKQYVKFNEEQNIKSTIALLALSRTPLSSKSLEGIV